MSMLTVPLNGLLMRVASLCGFGGLRRAGAERHARPVTIIVRGCRLLPLSERGRTGTTRSRPSGPPRPRQGACSFVASRASEMTTAPTSATPRPITARTTCQVGRLRRSLRRRIPIAIPTTGFATETVATEGASRPVPSDTCCKTNPTDARDRERVALPVREHRADALVQVVERRLRQSRREPEHDPGNGAVHRRLHREAAAAAEDEQHDARARRATPIAIAHSLLGAFSFPPAGSPK